MSEKEQRWAIRAESSCVPVGGAKPRSRSWPALRILDVGGAPSRISGDGTPPRQGSRFVVLGREGYAGVLASGSEVSLEGCRDECPDFERTAAWLEGQPTFARAVAVGPTDADSRSARLQVLTDRSPIRPEWQTLVSVDMDGDGRSDVEQRTRLCGCWEAVRESRVRHGEQWITSVRVFVPTHLNVNPHATPCPAVP